MRTGKKHQPSYRVVVADGRSPRDGRFVEEVGFYDPLTDPSTIRIDEARTQDWLSKGAQPSEAVGALLRAVGIWEKKQRSPKSTAKK